ncbi:hypothetical protein CK203_032807 [Vitis vinifera]|uniref:Disease resistance RPP13-like protein 1 n=1 Tax=Vitis vinifera TaxID=29760 RepID=A0A438I8D3_VITVI|nr:hypothetical protein CK203_032807 [Vitis vinifera]
MDMIGNLLHALRDYKPSMEEDSVYWKGGRNDKFRVKEAYRLVARPNDIVFPSRCIWVDSVPTKVAFYAGRLHGGGCSLLIKLQKRGRQLPNCCFLCGCEEETVNHILIHCIVVKVLWDIILGLSGHVHSELNKWKKILMKIYAVLHDAEEKQMTDPLVKMWLDELGDLAYDVEDILGRLRHSSFATQFDGRNSSFWHST